MNTSAQLPAADAAAVRRVLAHYGLAGAAFERIPQGLINLTLKVTAAGGERYILQRLNAVFDTAVNENLWHVTTHLHACGLATPLLVPTRAGALAVVDEGHTWRVLSYIDGVAFDAVAQPRQAGAAAALLARFHHALDSYRGPLAGTRPPVHDIERHLAALARAMDNARSHRLFGPALALHDELQATFRACASFDPGPPRLVHGDPKISNVLFAADGVQAICMVDLDTLACMPRAFELGDALRSWCNTAGEDVPGAHFDLAIFAAAMAAYCATAGAALSTQERLAIVPATLQIHLELAARFLADALEERYFAWDATRYDSAGAHNLARARAQLAAGLSLVQQRAEAESCIAACAPDYA